MVGTFSQFDFSVNYVLFFFFHKNFCWRELHNVSPTLAKTAIRLCEYPVLIFILALKNILQVNFFSLSLFFEPEGFNRPNDKNYVLI